MIELRKILLVAATGLASSLLAQDPASKPPTVGAESTPPAQTAPGTSKEVASLIRQLGSDSYRQRVDAEKRLRELGDAALPRLERTPFGFVRVDDRRDQQREAVPFVAPPAFTHLAQLAGGESPRLDSGDSGPEEELPPSVCGTKGLTFT